MMKFRMEVIGVMRVTLALMTVCFIIPVSIGQTFKVVHPGRHVCMKTQTVQTAVKKTQTYCKPAYKKHVHRCPNDPTKLCTSFRVIYELGYRDVYQMQATSQSLYSCCPGWTQVKAGDNGCLRPLCNNACQHGGTCSNPNQCRCRAGWSGPYCSVDVDECKISAHNCSHKCTNTAGSFKCGCQEGFTLSTDGKSCEVCLHCIPEYSDLLGGYKNVVKRVMHLEKDKTHMTEEFHKMKRKYNRNIAGLRNDVQSMQAFTYPPAPKPTEKAHVEDNEKSPEAMWNRLYSLSEQISLFEERMEYCSCDGP